MRLTIMPSKTKGGMPDNNLTHVCKHTRHALRLLFLITILLFRRSAKFLQLGIIISLSG